MIHMETVASRRMKSGTGWKVWVMFLGAGLTLSVRVGFECARYLDLRNESIREERRVESLRARAADRERELKKLGLDKGREAKIRNYGGLKPGEIPLPPPPNY